jgi:glycosyltransferase involved in cell wall biosynthesis
VRILLTTEGTYPYTRGGVSTWARSLIEGLAHHEFAVAAVVANPPAAPDERLPPNVAVLPVPLWGLEFVEEHIPHPGGMRRRRRTTTAAVGTRFLPPIEVLFDQFLVADGDPRQVAESLADLAEFAASYDLHRAMQDERVWGLLHDRLTANPLYRHVRLGEAIDLARSLYRYLVPLAIPIPDVDVVHASAAALCVLPAFAARLRRGIPLVLTEHGIYLRERILELIHRDVSVLQKVMFSNLYRAIARAAYHVADRVAPVCEYNVRWERELGVEPSKVRVIYNGVDPARFSSLSPREERPTIVWVGRIQPLKDLLTLIRAVAIVRRSVPTVVSRVYGPDTDPEYAAECREAVAAAGLEDVVCFEGAVADPTVAFGRADVVVLSSMSEGFPYTVVEAMMCARPVVATDVGGVAEALDDRTLLAEPQNAASLAHAVVRQLQSSRRERDALGRRLRKRAMERFDEQQFLRGYDSLYREFDGERADAV